MSLCACDDVVMCVARCLVPSTAKASAGSPARQPVYAPPQPSLCGVSPSPGELPGEAAKPRPVAACPQPRAPSAQPSSAGGSEPQVQARFLSAVKTNVLTGTVATFSSFYIQCAGGGQRGPLCSFTRSSERG